mgnify:CR=1 FL=1
MTTPELKCCEMCKWVGNKYDLHLHNNNCPCHQSKVKCPNCGGDIAVRNPTGKCDHLYYPENVPASRYKESPVSQSVDGLPSGEGVSKSRKLAQTLLGGIQYGDGRDNPEWRLKVMNGAEAYIDDFLKDTLSTLIKEMENKEKDIGYEEGQTKPDIVDESLADVYDTKAEAFFAGRDKGISAAIEVVKKMV